MKKFISFLAAAAILGACPTTLANDNAFYMPESGSAPEIRYTAPRGVQILSEDIDFPDRYDARDTLTFPAIRDQKLDGDCWAFASIAATEISLLNERSLLFDFSEAHMADNIYYNKNNPWCLNNATGGNRETAAMYFSRGSGPVTESSFSKDDPNKTYREDVSENLAAYVNKIIYLPDTERYIYSPNYTADSVGALYPQDERYILALEKSDGVINVGHDEEILLDFDDSETLTAQDGSVFYHIGKRARDLQIKAAVMKYGSVFSSYYADPDNKYLNFGTNSYYYPYSADDVYGFPVIHSINHAINIIGWDDNYPKGNFKDTPPANGAWIVRNSWGDDILDGGYMYISYYDSTIGENSAVFAEIEANPNFENIYQYDPFGQNSVFYMPNGSWVANRFDKRGSGDEYITEVGVYCYDANTKVDIAINKYSSYNGKSYITWYDHSQEASIKHHAEQNGLLFAEDIPSVATIKTQVFDAPGYYVIKLDEPVKIETDSFDVAVCYTSTDGSEYVCVPAESHISSGNYSNSASANENESYWITLSSLMSGDKTVAYVEGWDTMKSGDTLCNACIKVMTASNTNGIKFGGNITTDENGSSVLEVSAAGSCFESGSPRKSLIVLDLDGLITDIKDISDGETVRITLPSGKTSARVFLWEDLISIKPLADPITVTK